jgi:branched-subunit amino acid aminotransferase/4-amino-4-deoxychorismate lyase
MDINRNQINRSFFYGDLLFETIRIRQGMPMFLHLHAARLNRGAKLLQFNQEELREQEIQAAIQAYIQTHALDDARLRLRCIVVAKAPIGLPMLFLNYISTQNHCNLSLVLVKRWEFIRI